MNDIIAKCKKNIWVIVIVVILITALILCVNWNSKWMNCIKQRVAPEYFAADLRQYRTDPYFDHIPDTDDFDLEHEVEKLMKKQG